MDDRWRKPYVARAMNLLLLLSALLSALNGAGVGARRPEVAQAVAVRAVQAQPARMAEANVSRRPLEALPPLAVSAAIDPAAAPVALHGADLWASRRRE